METMTENELIAAFMGVNTNTLGYYITKNGAVHPNELRYDTSFDWLMPVVEKIATHVYESYESSNGYKNTIEYDRAYMRTFGMIDNEGRWMARINRMPLEQEITLIKATYQAVVEFIKWFNQQSKNGNN